MEISDKNPLHINTYVNQVKPTNGSPEAADTKGRTDSGEDSVELSLNARDLKLAQAALKEVPDVRSEAVARVKQQIEDGSYEVKPRKIAAKMITESLINKLP